MLLAWTTEKPKFESECLVIAATLWRWGWDYETYQIKYVDGEEGEQYLGWLNGKGEEYGALEDFTADRYFVMPLLT